MCTVYIFIGRSNFSYQVLVMTFSPNEISELFHFKKMSWGILSRVEVMALMTLVGMCSGWSHDPKETMMIPSDWATPDSKMIRWMSSGSDLKLERCVKNCGQLLYWLISCQAVKMFSSTSSTFRSKEESVSNLRMDAKLLLVLDLFQESICIYPIGYNLRGGA